METALAILLALGIYIGVPAVIGFSIVGAVVVAERRRRARAHKREATVAEAMRVEGQAETLPAEEGELVRPG